MFMFYNIYSPPFYTSPLLIRKALHHMMKAQKKSPRPGLLLSLRLHLMWLSHSFPAGEFT